MDQEGNIYDLAGNFIGTTDGEVDGGNGMNYSEVLDNGEGNEQFVDGDDY